MTDQVPRKLRLVRCPKCRRVLPELPNVPVYQCGGCGTVLQAKKRQVARGDAEPQATESVPVHKNVSENISCDKEAQKSSQEETKFDSNQMEIQVSSGEHSIEADSSPDISNKHPISGNRDSTVNINKEESVPKDVGCGDEFVNEDVDSVDSRDEFVSKDVDSREEFVPKNVDSRNEFVPKDVDSREDFVPKNIDSRDEFVPKDVDSREEFVPKDAESSTAFVSHDVNSLARLSVSTPDIDIDECVSEDDEHASHGNLEREEYLPKQVDGGDEKKSESGKDKLRSHVSFSDELIYSPEFNHLEHEEDENETFLERANKANVKLAEDFRSHSIFGSSPEDEISGKTVLNNDIISPIRKSFYNHEHMSSIDTLDNIAALRDFPESPITRSYYGFYGSSSSCDGNDDQAPDQNFQLSKRTIEKEFTNGKSMEMQGQNGYFSSSSSGSRQARFPICPRDQGVGLLYRSYSNDEVATNFRLPNKREYLEVEKIELLKKVRELEDQLKKSQISEGKQKGNFSRFSENQVRPCYDDRMYTASGNIYTNKSDAIKVRAERLYLGKKQTLPVTGGAPFLLCYSCSEVLQIPADFLSFKRRYHKLMCCNCSVILKFSLKNRTKLVKYIDHSSKYLSGNEPVSIDEPGPSFCKSFSTEEAPTSIEPQLDVIKKNFREKKISNSKKGSKFTNFVRNLGYVRSSSKNSKMESSTSESEEVAASANSPLHRLMGYHSATILLKADAQW